MPVEIPIEPVVVEAQKKYEKIVNDEIGVGVLESSERTLSKNTRGMLYPAY